MTKKILAALLAVMMLVSLLPAVFAVNTAVCPGAGVDHSKDNCSYKKADEPYVEPGCCTPGYQLYVCTVCGEHFASDIVPATEEDDCTWELESAYVAPDCLNDGAWAKYVCSVGKVGVKYTDADGNTVDPTSAEAQEAIDALGHDFGDIVDCHDGKECQRCDYAEEQSKHSWESGFNYDDIVIDTEPDETTNGSFHYECADCGASSPTYDIVACGHEMTYVQEQPATCTAVGVKAHYECSVCNKWYVELVVGSGIYREVTMDNLSIPAIPHTFKNPGDDDYEMWYTHIDPTCKTNGYTYKKCTVCEKWIEEEYLPASDEHHAWVIVEAGVTGTCDVEGKTEFKVCTICKTTTGGDVIPGTGKGHNEVKVTFAGTCTKVAYEFTYCTNAFCTEAKVTSLTDGTNTIDLTTIAADGVKILSYSFGTVNADVHNIGWYTTENATCQAGGHQVEMCLDCLDTATATGRHKDIPAGLSHCDFGTTPVQGATCTTKAVWECIYCERQVERGDVLGHDYEGQPVLTEPAHCTGISGAGVDGYTYQVCKNGCNEINKLSVIKYNSSYIYTDADEARSQHDLPAGYKEIYVQGDCEKVGLWTLGDCADCGRTVLLVDDETGKGHKMPTDATLITPATCTTNGGYTCQNAFCTLDNKWVVLEALGHTLTKVEAKDPDCLNDGNYEYYQCTREECGAILTSALTISDDKLSVTMPFMGIGQNAWVAPEGGKLAIAVGMPNMSLIITDETLDGTYTLIANTEYTFIIKDGKFEAALIGTTASQVIPALGHDSHPLSVGFGTNLNPSDVNNCIDFAYDNVEWCGRCYYSAMYGYKAATGHDYSDNEEDLVFDDCEEDGYYVCGNGCGVDKVVAGTATGHLNSDGDYFWSGCLDTEDNRHCVVCCEKNGTDPETCTGVAGDCLISNEHDLYVVIEDAPATCDQPGYDLWVCRVCDYEHIIINEPAHNHLDYNAVDWDVIVYPTFTEDGYRSGYCYLCGEFIEETLEKRDGIGFEIEVDNADAPGAGFTTSSLVEVTVSLSTSWEDVAIRGFNFNIAAQGALFVGYEYLSEDFDIYSVTTPLNAYNKGYVAVNGMASNNRLGEMQNVPVEGKNAVIKLYFRVMSASDLFFIIPDLAMGASTTEAAWLYEYDAEADEIVEEFCYGGFGFANVEQYMDITKDGAVTMTDVLEAYEMITNPEENEVPYSVVMDVDKDGSVTLSDLVAIMEYKANNADFEDMFLMGISDEELALYDRIF